MNPLLRGAFWQIWILFTAAAAICAAVLIKLDMVARSQTENDTYEHSRPSRSDWGIGSRHNIHVTVKS
jgi:hypothetical protein